MKKIIASVVLGAALSVSVAGVASADNPRWDDTKTDQVDTNRCANAGIGNSAEEFTDSFYCRKFLGLHPENYHSDLDPGNSGAHGGANEPLT